MKTAKFGGRFKAKPQLAKPKRKRVQSSGGNELTHLDLFKPFIGMVSGPKDLARNHTHYAHGGPKR